jgi:competence protein ComEA
VDGVLERYKLAIISVLVAAILTGLVWLWAKRPRPQPLIISTPVPEATPTTAPLRVYVSGAVQHPDVYLLAPQSIVKDAILAAGGATEEADMERINLAVELSDQQQVYVPRKDEEGTAVALPGDGVTDPSGVTGATVNINRASIAELDTLPGIGPAIAQRIVDYRTEHGDFSAPEDIMNVKGIGPATFEKLKDQITVR